MNHFGQKSKVVSFQKLIQRSGIRFLILFVLMDAIFWNYDISELAKGIIWFLVFSQLVYGKDQFPHKISNGYHRNTFFMLQGRCGVLGRYHSLKLISLTQRRRISFLLALRYISVYNYGVVKKPILKWDVYFTIYTPLNRQGCSQWKNRVNLIE